MTQRRVVVGYDGSQCAEQALRWAAERAVQRHLPLELVHALNVWPYDARGLPAAPAEAPHDLVDAAVQRLLAEHSSLDVRTCVDSAPPAALLLGRAEGAESLVVGARGHGGFPGMHLGSVGSHVASHARCPVVVVREAPGTGIVVGVDASSSSEHAVAFAFEQAAASAEPLTAVHAWLPFYAGLGDMPFYDDVRPVDDSQAALLSEHLAGWREKYPDVRVHEQVCSAHPVAALLDASHGARLLVVGSHGRGGFAGMLLGSVSRSLLHHASCSVAVVRSHPDEHR